MSILTHIKKELQVEEVPYGMPRILLNERHDLTVTLLIPENYLHLSAKNDKIIFDLQFNHLVIDYDFTISLDVYIKNFNHSLSVKDGRNFFAVNNASKQIFTLRFVLDKGIKNDLLQAIVNQNLPLELK